MLTWRKEWRINVNAEVCKEGRVNQCRSLKGGEMLDRDEHAEAMSQVIEKLYSLDLFSPCLIDEDTYFRSENCVYHRHIKLAIVTRLWVLIWGGKRCETSVSDHFRPKAKIDRTPYPLEQLKAAINFNGGVGKCTHGRSVAYFSRIIVHFTSEQGREASWTMSVSETEHRPGPKDQSVTVVIPAQTSRLDFNM